MKRREIITGLCIAPFLSYMPLARCDEQASLIDSLVNTPRSQLQLWVVEQIRNGRLSKAALVKALLSAGVSQIEPRPVGFKYHAVLMVDAARRLSQLASGIGDKAAWIPLLWNVDYFKHSQARSRNLSGWQLEPAAESLPNLQGSVAQFSHSMNVKDWTRADQAITQLARSGSLNQAFELMLHWAVKDFHSIGHKAILLSGVWRCLEYAGWRDSETILRGVAFALLADGAVAADETPGWWLEDYSRNRLVVDNIPEQAFSLPPDVGSTVQLTRSLQQADPLECRTIAVSILEKSSFATVWDAVFLSAADAVMNRPSIPMLHCVTVSHAFYALWQRTSDPIMRRIIPLQAVSYVAQMKNQRREGGWNGLDVLDLSLQNLATDSGELIDNLGEGLGYEPDSARNLILSYPLETEWWTLKQALNQWLLYKSNKAHDFKFGAAVLEVMEWISPPWRSAYLAACSRLLMGSNMPDSVEGQKIDEWFS